MSELFEAMNQTAYTENGALTNRSSLNKVLDLFFVIGAARGRIVTTEFAGALGEDPELAIRCLLWARDVRGGAGERNQFRRLMEYGISTGIIDDEVVHRIIKLIPEIGRFDDLLIFSDTVFEKAAYDVIADALRQENGLAAKWMPRQGPVAKAIRKHMGIEDPKTWRKMLVRLSNTVEQKMCAGQWEDITFDHVPSVASARYQNAFLRHVPGLYRDYLGQVADGKAKINAKVAYPYDVIRSLKNGDPDAANEQWNALPNYLEGSGESILPVVDTSGSMQTPVAGSTTALDVSVSLGLYLCERLEGKFKNQIITFSEAPMMEEISGRTLATRYQSLVKVKWGMNTNLRRVFDLILKQAKEFNLDESEMPTKVLIISDMEFDRCVKGQTNFQTIEKMYSEAGYNMPGLVFWNVCSRRGGNVPITVKNKNVALVSGFSPVIVKQVLSGVLNPVDIMISTLMVDRYDLTKV